MKTAAVLDMLAQSPVFAKAGPETLRSLAADAELMQLKARKHLFFMGEPAAHFYLVTTGSINLYRPSYSGDRKIFRTMEDGDLLVETAMFLDPPEYPLSAMAVSNSVLYRFPRASLLRLCRGSPDFGLAMLEGMAVRISQSLNRIDLLTVGNAAQRLVLYLMDVYIQQGTAWLVLPASQAVLSRQLNITPETLSRQMSNFRRAGLIGENVVQKEYNAQQMNVTLLDIPGLCKAVDLPAPDPEFERAKPTRRLGSSLFDCCNYASVTLGRMALKPAG
ncbi:Crp/Fnr family transcriptional regulator [Acidovorax sp. YS12]|nr:Crp/Fnr family transcriptional regulator [Acidovorax sp. YS12]